MVQESDLFDFFDMSQRELLEFARTSTEFCVSDMLDALDVAGGLNDLTEQEHRHRELLLDFLRATRANGLLQLFMETSNADTFTLDELVTWAIEEDKELLEDGETETDPELRRDYAASLAEDVEYLLTQKAIQKVGKRAYQISGDFEFVYH